MRLPSKERVLSSAVVLGLAGILGVLAVVQYRWSREVSEAASARMRASLRLSMMGFRQDFHRELAFLCGAFQSSPPPVQRERPEQYAKAFQAWKASASHPGLVANVFLLEGAGGEHPRLLHLNPATDRFEPGEWPSGFGALRERLVAASTELARLAPRFRPVERLGGEVAGRHAFNRPAGEHGHFLGPWAIEENIPALVHPLLHAPLGDHDPSATSMSWLILELNGTMLGDHIFPELAERYFGSTEGLEYRVAILGGSREHRFIYVSDPEFRKQDVVGADDTLNIFGVPMGPPGPRIGAGIFLASPRDVQNSDRVGPPVDGHRFGFGGMPRFEPIRYGAQDPDWQLVVQHRKGSLDAAVAAMRHRNLAVSFGVLLVLAATMAMIIVASRRAHRLARLQMDFVTGVSHELRTPLAVISSAADNIADGVVENKQQLIRYGTVIKNQTRQLRQLVEQILLYVASGRDRHCYNLRHINVEVLIDAVLNNTAELIRSEGFTVERNIEAKLPSVMGDLPALSHCLQNLITNSVKYSSARRWIGVRACTSPEDEKEIEISIEDKGIGIAPAELPHIFEPFYRGGGATSAQIHGTGLGLPLAKSIAEAMGGRLTVTSEPGQGSCFTLHLPVAGDVASTTDLAASTAAGSNSPSGHGA
jgi:signal transduction histidine kinase